MLGVSFSSINDDIVPLRAQILVTGYDFTCADRREHIQYCVNSLLKLVSRSILKF